MDGTVVASAIVKTISDKVSSPLFNQLSLLLGVKKDLDTLKSIISTVKDVLEDAEECFLTDKHVYNWLMKLKDNVYDTDDLLDKMYFEAQRKKDESRGKRVINNFLSKVNLVNRLKLAHKIRSINKKLNAIAKERVKFHLKSKVVKYKDINDIKYRETWSMINEDAIFGRDYEKEVILNQLLHSDGHDNISVISIVGLGGVGKTTLAQLAYNNEKELKEHFHLRMWVYVSQNFEIGRIVRAIIESVTKNKCDLDNLESLGDKLRSELNEKRYFLVLDDVWNDNQQEWEKLKCALNVGALGSKIIVTTRSLRVSNIIKASYTVDLKELSEEMSWALFKQRAFCGAERELHSQVLEIAKEIVKKCGGVPLALNALGSIMQFKDSIEEWMSVRNSDIWTLGDDGDQVMWSLKLSYMYLPPCLKACFTYCSIFPKGQVINKLQLINLWIAHGLVPVSDNMGAILDKGNEYFKHLVQMSFFQNVIESDDEVACTMHDLVHDLARSIVRPKFLEKNEGVMTNNDYSSRFISLTNSSKRVESTIAKKVRGLHIQGINLDVADMVATMECLRSLVLQTLDFDTFPKGSKLIHLRFLCIIDCHLKLIPDEICTLWSLQALHITYCYNIMTLPKSIGKLVHLRTLEVKCPKLEILPESIGQCRSLENLIVSSNQLEKIPITLGQLENIRLLNLSGCRKLKKLPDNSSEKFKFLRSINLSNCSNLEELPDSIGNFVSLENLNLSECEKLKYLPESIGNLHNLRVMNLEGIREIKRLPSSICKLVNLVTLVGANYLQDMPVGIGKLINLQRFSNFSVGQGNGCASISELQHLNFLSGELQISSLVHVNNPREAVQANLKKKQYLDSLQYFYFHGLHLYDIKPDDVFLAVLEALQPPSSIKRLELRGYPGTKYPNWMMPHEISMAAFPNLTSLILSFLQRFNNLPSLVRLPHLRYLRLRGMEHLTTVSGYFPSMLELNLEFMPNLEELTTTMNLIISEKYSDTDNAYESAFPRLSILRIFDCPKLKMQRHLPSSVVELHLFKSNEQLLTGPDEEDSAQLCPSSLSVRKLIIEDMKLSIGCELLRQLNFLRELEISDCEIDSLPESMRYLNSLRVLEIGFCKGLHALPEWLGELKSLERLEIWDAPLNCLPQSIKDLTALQSLEIWCCAELEKRCQHEIGEDWPLISHIPHVEVPRW